MINISQGQVWRSTSKMDDPVFRDSVILITRQDLSGTTAFIINRWHARKLNELTEFSHSRAFPLYDGGPVASDQLFFIHRRPDLVEEGALIKDAVFLGGNFKQVIEQIGAGRLHPDNIRLFIGYCGWDAGELEAEVEDHFWNPAESKKYFPW